MNKNLTLFCLCGYFLFVLMPSFGFAQEFDPLVLEARAGKIIYGESDEIVLTIYLRNVSKDPIDIVEPAINSRSLFVEINHPDKRADKLLAIQDNEPEIISLASGKRLKFIARFNPQMSGNYRINVRYSGFAGKTFEAAPISIYVVKH